MQTVLSSRLRLLPAVMISAALLLTLKVAGVVTGTSPLVAQVAAASEEASQEAAGTHEAEGDDHAEAEGGHGEDDGVKGRPEVNLAAPPAPSNAQSEDVLEALAARRKTLDQRQAEVEMREKLLAAAEARIDQKIEELKTLKAEVDEVFQTEEAKGDEKMKSLVKVYENMKPKDAAAVFEQMEMDVLLNLLDRMNERKLAAILASMDPARAQAVTVALATVNEDRLSAVPRPDAPAPMGLPELEPILPEGAG